MNRESRNAHIKRLILAAIVVFACIVQFSDSFFQKFFGVGILYTIPVVVCISMFQGEIISLCAALIAGVFWDSVSAQSVCFNTVFLCLCAFLTSYAVQKRLRNFLVTALILNFGAIFLHEILYWLLFVVTNGNGGAAYALFRFYIPSFLVTGVISVPIYYFINFIHRKFSEM
ncbi:MAG: hypothetical protein IJU39_04930 [Clostridia bacterium]|nr:hypothetical protein [Clostridia bacterium]